MEIEGKKIKWRKLAELPMNKQMCKKVLLLVEGRFSGRDSLHVVTDYWHVCFDKKYFNWDLFYKKEIYRINILSVSASLSFIVCCDSYVVLSLYTSLSTSTSPFSSLWFRLNM